MSEIQLKRAVMIVILVFLPPLLAAAMIASGIQIPLVAVVVASVIALLIVSIFRPGSGFVDADPDDLPVYDGALSLDQLGQVEVLQTDSRIWIVYDRFGKAFRLELNSRKGQKLRDLLQDEADLTVLDEAADDDTIVTVWRQSAQAG